MKGERFFDAKGRKFEIEGIWWEKRLPVTVDFFQLDKEEIIKLGYKEFKDLYDRGLIKFYNN